MRDLIVLSLVFAGALAALRYPWIGVMTWTWVSIMNPHKQAWGMATEFPVAALVAGTTLVGLLFEKERRNPFIDPSVGFLALFMVWICVTYPFSFHRETSTDLLLRALKIDLFVIITIVLLHSRKQIESFCWVVVLSLGLLGAKGGLFTILTGGDYRVWGPGGFILENNAFALALTMAIPLMRFLQLQQENKWIRRGLGLMMLLCAASILGSHSRGGMLALGAMGAFFWLKGPRKLVFGSIILIVGVALVTFMPEHWWERMATLRTYEQDQSAMGRINAWGMAWNLACDRFFGGGFDTWKADVFAIYGPNPRDFRVAHSIYFQVLGEHGFVGLIIWLAVWLLVWRATKQLINEGSKRLETKWCSDLGRMSQVSLVGYAIGGAFLSQAYFDLPYDILALVVITKSWLINNNDIGSRQINMSIDGLWVKTANERLKEKHS